jgi:hypothetical protein
MILLSTPLPNGWTIPLNEPKKNWQNRKTKVGKLHDNLSGDIMPNRLFLTPASENGGK